MNLIEKAVEPLKQQAIERAKEQAAATIKNVRTELAANNYDVQACAPYPSGYSSVNYFVALGKYHTFSAMTTWRKSSYSMHEPHYADVDKAKVARYTKDAIEQAGEAFDAYVAKLNSKIGTVTAARLSQTQALWHYSFLHVVLPNGEKQVWKTQVICNVSKLGKIFNQFPTRKVKGE